MDDSYWISLSRYRLDAGKDMLRDAKILLKLGSYASANNRAYYCFFQSMRAVLALDGEDYKRHSGVISRFNEKYVKTEIFSKDYGRIIAKSFVVRNSSDYEDFYICSIPETEKLVSVAEQFFKDVQDYLEDRYQQQ